uniref:DNA-directed RNA polymerase III subunit RPC5 n=1 Tax=Steinernema glaseri TaxID=37863 RepID=A0A1I8ALH8_9BILA
MNGECGAQPNFDSDEDSVIHETDVILAKPPTKLSRLLVPQGLRFETAKKISAQYKRRVGKLQMNIDIDCDSHSFDKHRMDEFPTGVNKHTLQTRLNFEGTRYSNKGSVNHVAGVVRNGKVYFMPVEHKFEMKRTLTHASQKNRGRNCMGSDGSDDEDPNKSANPLRVRFARPEDERQKKRREASSFHRTKVEEQDTWVPMELRRENTLGSPALVNKIVANAAPQDYDASDDESGEDPSMAGECAIFKAMLLDAPRKKRSRKQPAVYKKIDDDGEEGRSDLKKEPRYDRMKKSEIASFSYEDQIKAVFLKSLVLAFENIPVPEGKEVADVLPTVRSYARLVSGVWVARSELVYPDEVKASAQEKIRRLRAIYDFICCQFDAGNQVTRNDIVDIFEVSADDAVGVLQKIGRLNRDVTGFKQVIDPKSGTWELRIPRDIEIFTSEAVFQLYVEEQKLWVERLEEIVHSRC